MGSRLSIFYISGNAKISILVVLLGVLLFGGQVSAQVNANFSSTPTKGCGSLFVGFSDISTGAVTSWQWDFGNGFTSNLQNPATLYNTSGTFTVRLIVSDGSQSDTLIRSNYIEVFQNPAASFSTNANLGCLPLAVSFTNTTTLGSAPISTSTWDFGDGNGASTYSATNTYNSAGTFNPVLTVTDTNGCTNSSSGATSIQVLPSISANFTVDTNITCDFPFLVQFTNTSSGPGALSYAWDFGDGNTASNANPNHNYTVPGDKDVQLIVSNGSGCADTLNQIGLIQEDSLIANFSSNTTSPCLGAQVQFQDNSFGNPISWSWDFGDGSTSNLQNPTYIYNSSGIFDVELTVVSSLGCTHTLSQTNYISTAPNPFSNFNVINGQGCDIPMLVSFNQIGPSASSYEWDFGDGGTSTLAAPSHNYTSVGSFDVTLIVTNIQGCRDTLTQSNAVNLDPPPVAAFTYQTVQSNCRPLTYKFSDASTTSSGTINFHSWDFGDGNTSTSPSPNHTYTVNGSYTVTYIVGTSNGCFDTLVLPNFVYIGPKPTSSFTISDNNPCFGSTVTFTNTSTGSPTNFLWSFGNGDTSTLVNPNYIFPDTGCFDVNLEARIGGCIDSLNTPQTVCVRGVIPGFSASQYASCIAPVTINFTDLSQGSNLRYLWDFDDGGTSTLANPSHTFNTNGIYTVELLVEDTVALCSASFSRFIRVGGPTANFGADQTVGCTNFPVTFTDSTGSAVSWKWDFGDGDTSIVQHPVHIYQTAGVYDIFLLVTDSAGCRDTALVSNMITANTISAALGASRRPACIGESINFNDLSISTGNATNWQWDFGDGSPIGTGANPSHSYGNAGIYPIQLVVQDNNGCLDSLTLSNYVNIIVPAANFSQSDTNLCPGENLNFTNSSTGLATLSYNWDFGDGNSSLLSNPSYAYAADGNYIVTLTTTDSAGCTDTFNRPMVVSSPMAAFSISDSVSNCPPLMVNFSQMGMGNISNYQWNFGDGGTSILPNPSHTYSNPGNFDVQLVVSTPSGCADTLLAPNKIQIGQANGNFSFNTAASCVGQSVRFILVANQNFSPIWDFGDGSVTFAGDTVDHFYANAGIYTPILTVIDTTGCQNTVPSTSSLQIFPAPVAAIALSDSLLCPGDSIQLNDNSTYGTSGSSILWDFGNGNGGNTPNESTVYSAPGYYDIAMQVTDSLGCSDSILVTNALRVLATQANFNALPNTVCANTLLNFVSSSTSDTTLTQWNWNFGDSILGNGATAQHSYALPGNYDVALHVTNAIGCEDSITVSNALSVTTPNGSFFFTPELICQGDSTFFTFVGDTGVIPTWYFGDGDSAIGGDTIWHQYTVAGIYTPQVLMTDTLGCTAFTPGAGNVQVMALPQALIWIDASQLCRYDTLNLADSTNYAFGPGTVNWEFGDGNTGSGASISHYYITAGSFDIIMHVTDAMGCLGSDTLLNAIRTPTLEADFYASDSAICIPQSVLFTDTSRSDTTIVAWNWSFGDGNIGAGTPDSNTYTTYGQFDVSLIVTDANGCMDTISKRKFISASLPQVPEIWAASVAGDDLVAINVKPVVNPLFKEYEVWGINGPGSYYYIDNGAHINNGLIFDEQNNTLYTSICYRALVQDQCDNKSELDSAETHCTIELTAIPAIGAIDLVWSGYVGWDTILRYDIMAVSDYDTAAAQVQLIASVPGNVTTFLDTTLTCNERRTYRIRAIGSFPQEKSWSDTSATRPNVIPSPEGPELIVATVQDNVEIQVEWGPGNLAGITAYDLERSLDNTNWTPLGNFPSTTLQYTDQAVDVAIQSYFYRVSATDACALLTPYSNLGQSMLLNIDPSGNAPILQWNAYQEWDSLDHYELEARPSAGGAWINIASLPASNTSYTDLQGIPEATGVCYRIVAYENAGNQAVSTSNEACVSDELWIPNTLTPNGDGFNDVWIVQGLAAFPVSSVNIYNRWGNLIYESPDYQNDWYGTNSKSNETLPDGTYFYVLKLSDGQILKGQVTIMR